MNPEQFTHEEVVLIERLQNIPKSNVPMIVQKRIQTQLWDEMDKIADKPVSSPQPQLPVIWVIVAIVAIIGLIMLGIVFMNVATESGKPMSTRIPETLATETVEPTPENNLVETSLPNLKFSGVITEINAETILVEGVAIDITNAVLPTDNLATGMTVQVIGIADGQVIRATLIVIAVDNSLVATEAMPTASPEGTTPSTSLPQATVTSQTPIAVSGAPIIVIEGPVEAINITSITIFDIDIQVDPSDPILTEIRIGDTLRIEGQSSIESNSIIIVAINITIVETTIIVINESGAVYVPIGIPTNCRTTPKGKVTCKKK